MVSLLVLIPLFASVIVLLIPRGGEAHVRRVATLSCLATLFLSLYIIVAYDVSRGGIQREIILSWSPTMGIQYHTGADGLGVVMILLHSLISLSGVMVSYSIKDRVKEYYFFFLLLIASIYGVFTSFDLFFLYFFYEMAVIPMYPLIGMWGSKNKEYATMKLTLYITAGAVIALIGILALYHAVGFKTFDLVELRNYFTAHPLPGSFQIWVSGLVIFGFGVIASLWPTHSWSPIGYAAAPSAVSMIHAGVLKKMGPFLMIRIALSIMPEGVRFWLPIVSVLCMANILYAGYCAMAQKDLKFIIGFSSVSHMGYVLLGLACLNEAGLAGAVLLMFSHGVMAALAFALVGFVYEQTHTRDVEELGGGLARKLPFIATCFALTAMASLGLPGFSNFVAEILILFGSWKAYPVQAVVAVVGLVVTSVYLLRAVRNVFFGTARVSWESLKDARSFMDRSPYVLLLSALVVFGFFPQFLVDRIDAGIRTVVETNIARGMSQPRHGSTVLKMYSRLTTPVMTRSSSSAEEAK